MHHIHGYSFHEFSPKWESFLFSQLERIAGKACDLLIFVNEEERIMSVEKGWLPASKACTVYNGVDLNKFDLNQKKNIRVAFRKRWGLAPKEYCVTFIGRIWRQKNPAILADIAASLRQKDPKLEFKILVAGNGPLEASLRKRIREFKVDSNFRLLGWVNDNLSVTFGSDVVILPSLWEGLPITLMEAQASGLPIIVSNIKGNREVVTPETGFICRPKNPEDYADAIIRLSDSDLRRTMGEAARHRAELLFNSAANNQKIIECYNGLLAEKGLRN